MQKVSSLVFTNFPVSVNLIIGLSIQIINSLDIRFVQINPFVSVKFFTGISIKIIKPLNIRLFKSKV